MIINPLLMAIRAKKLGVLIKDARLAHGKTVAECAQAIGVDEQSFEAFESGERSPSLPEIEILAYSLNLPVEHFRGNSLLSSNGKQRKPLDTEKIVALRQRMIGALIRKARLEVGFSLEDLAQACSIPSANLETYELGEESIPMPELEVICLVLETPIGEFEDRQGPVGIWSSQQRALQSFTEMSPELQAFVSKPVNRPYLEAAQRLSEMSVDKLRTVAEVLLEITL